MAGPSKNDRFGSTEPKTPYEGHRRATSAGRVRSAWALVLAAIFLLLIVAALFFWPQAKRTAPADPPIQGEGGSAIP